jgi:opacity protein-like surface antigen
MRNWKGTTYCILALLTTLSPHGRCAGNAPTNLSLQEDGSLVVFDAKGGVAEFVKQGTPRQAIQLDGQSCNVSYGFNSSGKQTVLVSLPASATTPVVFLLGDSQVTIPPKSGLRIALNESHKIEKMDGAPAGTVQFQNISSRPQPPTQLSPTPIPIPAQVVEPTPSPIPAQNPQTSETTLGKNLEPVDSNINLTQPATTSTPADPMAGQGNALSSPPTEIGWPGKLLQSPLTEPQMEEDYFYVRTEGGARFVSSMNIVNIVGPVGATNPMIQKEIAFSTGYRQDIDIGVWLTPWFGLAVETGFALNAIRGNTEGMTVSSSTYWSVPIMAQLCFQYPNDTGFIPYLNFGFGGGWNYFNIGSISYPPAGQGSTLSGAGNDMNNAYQIAAGVRWRIWEQLGLTLAYKFYGTSQPTVDMGDNQQVTFGSPVTNSIELGGNFSF